MRSKKADVIAHDGTTINSIIFYSEDRPKGILLVCHGFGEHAGRYEEFAKYLTAAGYLCVVFDQRGHGEQCDRKTFGIIPRYECFLNDIDAMKIKIQFWYPGVPIFLYGHSMGGNIAINYLLGKGQKDFKGAVLETPWLRLYEPKPYLIVVLARVLGRLNRNWTIDSKLNHEEISGDRIRNSEIAEEELFQKRISFRMFAGISDAGENAIKHAAQLSLPTMLVWAGEDKIVSPAAIKEFAGKANPNVFLEPFDTADHSVHNDTVKEDYFKAVIRFLDFHCQVIQEV